MQKKQQYASCLNNIRTPQYKLKTLHTMIPTHIQLHIPKKMIVFIREFNRQLKAIRTIEHKTSSKVQLNIIRTLTVQTEIISG